MCLKCRSLPALQIGILPEKVAAECDSLWKTWCLQNQESIEKDVMGWLGQNSHVLRIMNLGNLPKTVKKRRV